jgi:uncharacterized membrane protein
MDSQKVFDIVLVLIGIIAVVAIIWPVYLGIIGDIPAEDAVQMSTDTMIGFAFGPLILGSNLLSIGGIFIPIGFLVLIYWVYKNR